jgi:hypothetical protein
MEQPSVEYDGNNATINQIQRVQADFYEQTPKNVFFKTDQKFKCAQTVSSQINIDQLIHHTTWIIPGTNKVFFDYLVFKTYACPDNFYFVVDKIVALCADCSNTWGSFEFHLNMDTFSISAVERYRSAIVLFSEECMRRNTGFVQTNSGMYLYNIPRVMDQVARMLKPIIDPGIYAKFVLLDKKDSPERLRQLFLSSETVPNSL